VELIAWKTVKGKYPDTEHVKFKTLPPVKVASCMVKGGYEQMPEVYGAVISWVNDNGYECAGPMFNIYHVSPHETQNPDEYVTEVCYAVK
jgi:effector-binding domain-containing protein